MTPEEAAVAKAAGAEKAKSEKAAAKAAAAEAPWWHALMEVTLERNFCLLPVIFVLF
jgi:hypothetical protein